MNLLKIDYFKKYNPMLANHCVPIGCILIYEQENITYYKNHNNPWKNQLYIMEWNGNNPIDHCELKVISMALDKGWDLNKCTLMVTCEPCCMCLCALSLIKIKRIVFGCYNKNIGALGGAIFLNNYCNFLHQAQIIGPINEDFWSRVLQEFFKLLR